MIFGNLLYLVGLVLAGYSGAQGLPWFFIIISSLIMLLGYILVRLPQQYGLFKEHGPLTALKALSFSLLPYLVIVALVYFIATFFA